MIVKVGVTHRDGSYYRLYHYAYAVILSTGSGSIGTSGSHAVQRATRPQRTTPSYHTPTTALHSTARLSGAMPKPNTRSTAIKVSFTHE